MLSGTIKGWWIIIGTGPAQELAWSIMGNRFDADIEKMYQDHQPLAVM